MTAEKKKGSKPPVFSLRRMRSSDLEDCVPLLQSPFSGDPAARKKLLAFWRHLVESEASASGVIEDMAQPRGKKLVGFGVSFFATIPFAQETKTAPPFLPLRAVEQWRQGARPFLTREEIAKANSGEGLICVPVNFGMDLGRYGPEDMLKLQEAVLQMFFKVHAGYRITEFLQEVYGKYLMSNFTVMGLSTLRDYREFGQEPHLARLTDENRPYLMSAKPGRSPDWNNTQLFTFFTRYSKPRFYFRPGEQQVLEESLLGGTDEEIAKTFKLSLWSVKKRWQTIYTKVEERDWELLAGTSSPQVKVKGKGRVKQKRRYLLNYLKDHPEELRPLVSPRRRKA